MKIYYLISHLSWKRLLERQLEDTQAVKRSMGLTNLTNIAQSNENRASNDKYITQDRSWTTWKTDTYVNYK